MKILLFLLLISRGLYAQVLPETRIKDELLVTHLHSYIKECRQLNLIKDSTGIIVLQYNQLQNGHQILFSAIDKERQTYFTTRSIPSQYAYFEGVLILIRSGIENKLEFSKEFYLEVNKVVEGKYVRLEEEKGALVVYERTPDGVLHRNRELRGGNVHNNVRIVINADGTYITTRDI